MANEKNSPFGIPSLKTSGTGTRDAAARQRIANEFFPGATYLGGIVGESLTKVVRGETIDLPGGGKFDLGANRSTLACVCCGLVAGVKGDPNRAVLIGIYSKAGADGKTKIVGLSDSCRANYVQAAGLHNKLTNPDLYKQVYKKTGK